MKIYLQGLEKYNNGCSLCGEWIDLKEINEDELNKKMKKLIDKEFIILDWEYEDDEIFFQDIISEYTDPFELLDRQKEIEALSDSEKNFVKALIINGETFEDAIKLKDEVEIIDVRNELSPFGESHVALAQYFVDEGLIKIPDNITPYIDFKRLGRDLALDYSEPIEGLFIRY